MLPTLLIALGTAGVAVLMLIGCLKKKRRYDDLDSDMFELNASAISPVILTGWEIGEQEIVHEAIVSETEDTTVWRGTWRTFAADIRYLKQKTPWPKYDVFGAAMMDLTSLQHDNLALIYGGGISANSLQFVVAERTEGGVTLRRHLAESKPRWRDRQAIGAGVAAGLDYLHRSAAAHRNLSSSAVMIDGLGVPKLIDYGVGKVEYPPQRSVAVDGHVMTPADAALDAGVKPPLWLAPEVLSLWDPATGAVEAPSETAYAWRAAGPTLSEAQAADVYSFAIVLWELLVDRTPWGEIPAATSAELASKVQKAVVGGRRPAIPPENAKRPAAVMIRRCWAQEPTRRPRLQQIVKAFEANALEEVPDPAATRSRAASNPAPVAPKPPRESNISSASAEVYE